MSDEISELRAELERVRHEGLEQAEASDAGRRESQRQKTMMERFRAQADELRAQLSELGTRHEEALGRLDYVTRATQTMGNRIEQLTKAIEEFGEHQRRCKYNAKKGTACTCGLKSAVDGSEE